METEENTILAAHISGRYVIISAVITAFASVIAACLGFASGKVNIEESLYKDNKKLSSDYAELNANYLELERNTTKLQDELKSYEQEYNKLQDELKSYKQEYNELQEKYNKLKSSDLIAENPHANDDTNTEQSPSINRPATPLQQISLVDSENYHIVKNMTDSKWKNHDLAYSFDSSLKTYAVYDLNKEYTFFSTNIVTAHDTGTKAKITVEIYLDSELVKKYEDITTKTSTIILKELNVFDVDKMTIVATNFGEYSMGFVYLTNAFCFK